MRRIPPFAYEIRVLKEDTANAMALPGGRILIHSGLMDAIKSDGGLLFVIGHEIGHIAGKDHLRSMGRGLVFSVVTALLFGDGGATTIGTGMENFFFLKNSRDQEIAADEWGVRAVLAATGGAEGASEFFDHLTLGHSEETKKYRRWAILLSTHPYAGDRAKNIKDVIRRIGR